MLEAALLQQGKVDRAILQHEDCDEREGATRTVLEEHSPLAVILDESNANPLDDSPQLERRRGAVLRP